MFPVENSPMEDNQKNVWLAAAEVEQRQFELDEATYRLKETVEEALAAGADVSVVAEAAGVSPIDILASTDSSAATITATLTPQAPPRTDQEPDNSGTSLAS